MKPAMSTLRYPKETNQQIIEQVLYIACNPDVVKQEIILTEQPENESTEQLKNELTEQPKNESTEQPKNESTEQPKNESTEQPKNELTEQPKNESLGIQQLHVCQYCPDIVHRLESSQFAH